MKTTTNPFRDPEAQRRWILDTLSHMGQSLRREMNDEVLWRITSGQVPDQLSPAVHAAIDELYAAADKLAAVAKADLEALTGGK